ncbi:MAG TPA: glycine zipper 2TM domain-containing protein [Azospirillaceae bacterium]|nr:glycine zipper 2TM domain-containing protein [Azospirillaceae bacterium]
MTTKSAAVLVALMLAPLGACTSSYSPNTITGTSVGAVNRTVPGTVVSARPVTLRPDDDRNYGTAIGGVAGGVAGSALGGNTRAGILGALGGAVLGGLAGNVVADRATQETGIEYVVRLEDNQLITLVQGADMALQPGQSVLVVYGRRARLVPVTS